MNFRISFFHETNDFACSFQTDLKLRWEKKDSIYIKIVTVHMHKISSVVAHLR